MGAGRCVVAIAALAAACGGKSATTDARSERPEDVGCKTSFACPFGQRCEGGECVEDRTCPEARDPEFLFEAPAGSTWDESPYQSFEAFAGREFLAVEELDETERPIGRRRFLELATGRVRTLLHDAYYVSCYGSTARCMLLTEDGSTTLAEIELDKDSVRFREGLEFTFDGGGLWDTDASYREGLVALTSDLFMLDGTIETTVELRDLRRLPPVASLSLVDVQTHGIHWNEDGRGGHVNLIRLGDRDQGTSDELFVAELETGAPLEQIYSGPYTTSYLFALRHESGWFIVKGASSDDDPPMSVYRGLEEGGTLVGSLDISWGNQIDYAYREGSRPLEPGPSVYAYSCDGAGCESQRIMLDPVGIEEVASIELPERGYFRHFARGLACGGADLFVITKDLDDTTTRFWSLRIPGREGFP